MRWLCIDATAPGSLVVCFEGGVDLRVGERLAQLVTRRTGRLISTWRLPRA